MLTCNRDAGALSISIRYCQFEKVSGWGTVGSDGSCENVISVCSMEDELKGPYSQILSKPRYRRPGLPLNREWQKAAPLQLLDFMTCYSMRNGCNFPQHPVTAVIHRTGIPSFHQLNQMYLLAPHHNTIPQSIHWNWETEVVPLVFRVRPPASKVTRLVCCRITNLGFRVLIESF